jgi:transposase
LNRARQHYADDRQRLCDLHTQELLHANELVQEQDMQQRELQQILQTCQDELESKSQQLEKGEQELRSVRSLLKRITALMLARTNGAWQKRFRNKNKE